MKSLVCTKPGHFEYRKDQLPVLTPGHAILKIKRVGICGTDIHAFEGTQPFFNYPRILGHELAADLIEADGAAAFKPGDPVTLMPYFNCGNCTTCKSGRPNCCVQLEVFGIHIDGGMAEYVSVPSSSLLLSAGLDHDALALVEPLSIGAHAVNRAGVKKGQYVMVLGAGPIGIAVMDFAKMAGAIVLALDINPTRLQFCKDRLKADYTLNASNPGTEDQIRDITSGDMPAVVFDATGNLGAINGGFRFMAHGGSYVLVGLQKEEVRFSHPEFHKREGLLMSSRNALKKDFEQVIAAIKEEKINPAEYITHRISFMDLKNEFISLLRPSELVIKAMVNLDGED
jgi:2-desacetyl-2-hydroxyethyl bacteriochlorophyllide A dehydrogenase